MVWWRKVFTTKPDDLTVIRRAHMGGAKQLPGEPLLDSPTLPQ